MRAVGFQIRWWYHYVQENLLDFQYFKAILAHLFHRFLMDSFRAWGCLPSQTGWVATVEKDQPSNGIKGDTQIQQTKGKVLANPSVDVEMILLIDKILQTVSIGFIGFKNHSRLLISKISMSPC